MTRAGRLVVRAWYGLRTRYSKMSKNCKAGSPNTLRPGRSALCCTPKSISRQISVDRSRKPFRRGGPFRCFGQYTGGKTAGVTVMPRGEDGLLCSIHRRQDRRYRYAAGRGRVALVNAPAARPPALRYAAGERTAGAFGPQQRLYLAPDPQGHGAPRGIGADSAATGKVCTAGGRGA